MGGSVLQLPTVSKRFQETMNAVPPLSGRNVPCGDRGIADYTHCVQLSLDQSFSHPPGYIRETHIHTRLDSGMSILLTPVWDEIV
jgi:hypothetical protein